MRTVATAMTLALASGCGRVAFEPVRVEPGDSGIINGDATSLCTQRHIYGATASTFFEARASCAAIGGWVVALADEAENAEVRALAPGDRWIGYTDLATEGTFVWETGDPPMFMKWVGSEPNDGAGTGAQDCTAMRADGYWHDEPCTFTYPFVCECP